MVYLMFMNVKEIAVILTTKPKNIKELTTYLN